MDLLKILLVVFLLFFPLGELGRFQTGSLAFSVNDILLISVFITFLFKIKKFPNIKGDLKKPILIFIIVGFMTLILNLYWLKLEYFLISLLYLLRWSLYASLYFVINSFDKKFIEKLKTLILIPISFVIIGGYIQFIFYQSLRNLWYLGWDEHLYRFFAGFLDPNFTGSILVMTLIYLIHSARSVYRLDRNRFLLLTVLGVLNFLAVYLTYSRSALIMLFISVIVYLILIGQKKFIFILAFVSVIILMLSPKSFQTEGTNLLRIKSSAERIESAQAAIKIITKNPVIGVGFNTYRYAMNRYGIGIDGIWKTTHSGAGTDNSFLFIFATTGIIGLISFIYLLYKIFKLCIIKSRKNKFSFVLMSVLIGIIVNSLFVNSLFFVYVLELIWIYVGFTENS